MKLYLYVNILYLSTIIFIEKTKSLKQVENIPLDNNMEIKNKANDQSETTEISSGNDNIELEFEKIGNYSYFLTTLELQKKIRKCSSLIEENKKKIAEIRMGSNEKKTSQEKKKLNLERAMYIDNNIKINMYCNMFINLLLYKRIKMFYSEKIDPDPKSEYEIELEMSEVANNFVINEENAAFIRSLVQKTMCESFQESIACKLLTNKLMNYMAVTPCEIVQEFEDFIIEDSNK
ncbi:hypothetical protein FG386_002344 [Cryptosporidium ryanae]|uniref:uncharacterized protein n=1 Tax=Cryptosporidium ryanae TaxID=515981 RepID=UPI00351A52F7|nr:hypothetical protein FG386_002344 [Cryptosporidium ryanae]